MQQLPGGARRSTRIARRFAQTLLLGTTIAFAACGGGDGGMAPVQPPPVTVTAVDLTVPSTSIVSQQTVQLTAVTRLSNGTTNTAPNVTWTSAATAVATVNGSGLVTGVAPGTTVITATVGTVSATASITVTSSVGVLASVVVSLADPALLLAQTTRATVTGRDASGGPATLGTRTVTWSSSSNAIATVSATGLVTAVGIGTVNIQVSVADGATARIATAPLTITAIPGAPVTADVTMPGLTFSPFETLVKQGGTVRFVFPSLAHNVIWDPRLSGQPAAPTDINTTTGVVVTRTFPNVGVFTYKCTLHPGMDGTIIVSP